MRAYIAGISMLIMVVFSGCVSIPEMPQQKFVPELTAVNRPDEGENSTVGVGEIMLSQTFGFMQPSLHLLRSYDSGQTQLYAPEGIYDFIGTSEGRKIFESKTSSLRYGRNVYPRLVEDPDGTVYAKNGNLMLPIDSDDYMVEFYRTQAADEARKTLTYTGGQGEVIHLVYREYRGTELIAGSMLECVYDLRKGELITCMGASLKVVSADNETITFILLSPFQEESGPVSPLQR